MTKNEAYIAELTALRDGLQAESKLHEALDAYLAQLASPPEATRANLLHIRTDTSIDPQAVARAILKFQRRNTPPSWRALPPDEDDGTAGVAAVV